MTAVQMIAIVVERAVAAAGLGHAGRVREALVRSNHAPEKAGRQREEHGSDQEPAHPGPRRRGEERGADDRRRDRRDLRAGGLLTGRRRVVVVDDVLALAIVSSVARADS